MPSKILVFLSLVLVFLFACSTPQTHINNTDKTLALPELALPECEANQQGFTDLKVSEPNLDNDESDLSQFAIYNELTLPWPQYLEDNPSSAQCFVQQSAQALDVYLAGEYPVTNAINHSILLLGRQIDKSPIPNIDTSAESFGEAIEAICKKAKPCQASSGHLPPELAGELAPIMWTILDGIEAREKMDSETTGFHTPEWWWQNGGNLLFSYGEMNLPQPDLTNTNDRKYLLGAGGLQALYNASARIAFAVEHADLERFKDADIAFSMETSAGWIIIQGNENNSYIADGKDILFFLDLGGNDVYQNPIASNTSWKNPVSIAIDLDGDDTYAYMSQKNQRIEKNLLPADRAGRYRGDSFFGNITLSQEYRQGAGRNGIAMLFDFGKGSDFYQSLRCSQGCAQLGVGVLFDDGGAENTFLAEDMSQGSAQFGIGINIVNGNGANSFGSFSHSQGFGHVGGAGIHVSKSRSAKYLCNIGDPAQGGIAIYYSPHLPGKANFSMCQGAGSGKRTKDIEGRESFLPGGIGILRHTGENSEYICSTFCQGAGIWRGTGVFSSSENNHSKNFIQNSNGYAEYFGIGIYENSNKGE